MTNRFRTVAGTGSNELIVKKSRFICTVARITTEDEARSFLAQIKKVCWDASHNCSAWVIGERGEMQRSNDDGEPSGTAGLPMLNVLNQRELTDTIAVVTRYFGGTLLGAGGLIRVYGQSVSNAVDRTGIVERKRLTVVAIEANHDDAGRLENALRGSPFQVAGIDYGVNVRFELHLELTDLSSFSSWLAETTAGRCQAEVVRTEVAEVPVERGQ